MSEKNIKKFLTKKNILKCLTFITVLILFFTIWALGFNCSKNKYTKQIKKLEDKISELENTPIVIEPVTPEIVRKIISENISEISELATAEYNFTTADRFTQTKHIAILPDSWTEKSFIQKWDGIIKAGIALEKVDVHIKETTVTIALPHAEILSYEIDNNSVEILDEKSGIFNPIKVDDKIRFDRESEYDMKDRAVKNGLLTKAEKNAEAVISNFLKTILKNSDEYTFVFEFIDE